MDCGIKNTHSLMEVSKKIILSVPMVEISGIEPLTS